MTGRALAPVKPVEPWRQRLIRRLLYGGNVDRAAKARARVGFAIVAFAAIYAVIGGRLVMFAVGGDSHGARRTAAQDAIATARPDIVDRNGEVLATDVKTPSLFGEPRRIIDKDEAIELLTATLPDLDTGEVRDRLSGKKGFVWLKREITPVQQQEIHRLGIPGIGFLRENKRVYPTGAEVAHLIGLVNIDNQGIAGMEKWLDNNGLADLHRAGFATDRLQRPVELSIDLRVEHALRDELMKAKEKFHAKAASGLVSNVRTDTIATISPVLTFETRPEAALAWNFSLALSSSSRNACSTRRSIDSSTGFCSRSVAKPARCRSARPLLSSHFSIPAMPWLSMLTRPIRCATSLPVG